LLIPPEDADALAAAMRRLADDPVLREELGARGREVVESRFTLDLFHERIVRFLEDAAAARAPS
jgi:glycosyltransferase involved in cell wall biosynthesis